MADTNLPVIKTGKTVKVELEKGQGPVKIKATKEMVADREAAFRYATEAVKNQAIGEIQLCVAAALYLGKGTHAPWVLDGFDSPREAVKSVFGWSDMKASYRRRIGEALIDQYGKEHVIEKAQDIGLTQVPQCRLREFLKVPKQFAQLLNRGRIALPDGGEITIDNVIETRADQLPLLFERMAAQPRELEKDSDDVFGDFDKDNPLAEKKTLTAEDLLTKENEIAATYNLLRIQVEQVLKTFVEKVKLWPKDAVAVSEASPKIKDSYDRALGAVFAAHNAATCSSYNPDGVPALAENREGTLDDFLKEVKTPAKRGKK